MYRASLKTGILRLIATLTLALTIASVLSPSASANRGDPYTDAWIDNMVSQLIQTCADAGGVSSVHYIFEPGGHLSGATVRCIGQVGSWGDSWLCDLVYDGTWYCTDTGLTRPPVTRHQTGRYQGGAVFESVDTGYDSSPPLATGSYHASGWSNTAPTYYDDDYAP